MLPSLFKCPLQPPFQYARCAHWCASSLGAHALSAAALRTSSSLRRAYGLRVHHAAIRFARWRYGTGSPHLLSAGERPPCGVVLRVWSRRNAQPRERRSSRSTPTHPKVDSFSAQQPALRSCSLWFGISRRPGFARWSWSFLRLSGRRQESVIALVLGPSFDRTSG